MLQSKFPSALPSDVVFEICSHLSQADCVQSMRVCRHWYLQLPLYVTDVWKQIVITPRSWKKSNQCLLRCLGPHVRDVVIQNVSMFAVLNRLKESDCVIHSLAIEGHVVPFGQLIDGRTKLLASISQFKDSLTELCIQEHESYILLPHQLLIHYPNLTHLTLLFRPVLYKELFIRRFEQVSSPVHDHHTQLVYLHLDAGLDFDSYIVPALRHCPNLQFLLLSTTTIDNSFLRTPSDLDIIFQLCPKLRYLMWNKPRHYTLSNDCLVNDWKVLAKSYSSSSTHDGALYTLLFHGDDINALIPALTRSQHVLERLELKFRFTPLGFDGDVLSRIDLSRLKSLSIGSFKMTAASWISLLAGYVSLESLTLEISKDDVDMDTLCVAICKLERLTYLKLLRPDAYRDDVWSNSNLLTRTQLECFELKGASLTTEALLNLCDIPSLKSLSLSIFSQISHVSIVGLRAFADKLAINESRLETLKLSFFDDLDNNILERLALVQSLSLLSIVGSSRITDAGVRSFVKSHKRMEVQQCLLVLRWGIWVEENVSL